MGNDALVRRPRGRATVTVTFEDFFRSHYAGIEAGVRSTGATAEVAADAAQEAFVRAYPRWWRISRYRNPAAWVQRVAINVRRDIERSERRRSTLIDAIEVEQRLDPTAASATQHRHELEALPDVVEKLPRQQQRAVRAYYGDDLSTTEAAASMGISPGAVRFHLSEARAALRPLLATELTAEEA